MDATVKVDAVLKNAGRIIKEKQLSHDAFTVSEILGAALLLPKEYVLEKMLEANDANKED